MNNPRRYHQRPLQKSTSLYSVDFNDDGNKGKDFYDYRRHSLSDTSRSVEVMMFESDSDDPMDGKMLVDSGIGDKTSVDNDILALLEQKIEKLNDMFLEQCRQLKALKDEIHNSKLTMEKSENLHNQLLTELLKKAIAQRMKDVGPMNEIRPVGNQKSQAQSLLDAIEFRKAFSLDREIKEALTSFLQSEELKDQMVQATAESVKDVIGGCVSRDVSSLYLPMLERSHRRLVRHIAKVVEDSFNELEENSASLSKSVYQTSKTLRRALERHQTLLAAAANPGKDIISTLQYTVEELLQKELKQWRQKVLDILSSQLYCEAASEIAEPSTPLEYTPISPLQPSDSKISIIDQLMMAAEINKKIQDGDINGSFVKALSASNLSLVMTACRAVDPAKIFTSPCCLDQSVLLSLVQQLATDMVHETQLKCRYLEDAIINLNNRNPDTREHLPLVVGEVRKHLSSFLSSYPSHVASRRITLIIMAADKLLK